MEITEKRITAGLERPEEYRDLTLADDDLLAVQFVALELFGRGVLVVHEQLDLLPGRNRQLGRIELVVADHDFRVIVFRARTAGREQQRNGKDGAGDRFSGGYHAANDNGSYLLTQLIFYRLAAYGHESHVALIWIKPNVSAVRPCAR